MSNRFENSKFRQPTLIKSSVWYLQAVAYHVITDGGQNTCHLKLFLEIFSNCIERGKCERHRDSLAVISGLQRRRHFGSQYKSLVHRRGYILLELTPVTTQGKRQDNFFSNSTFDFLKFQLNAGGLSKASMLGLTCTIPARIRSCWMSWIVHIQLLLCPPRSHRYM